MGSVCKLYVPINTTILLICIQFINSGSAANEPYIKPGLLFPSITFKEGKPGLS